MEDRNAPATRGDSQDLKGAVHHLAGSLEDFKVEFNTRFTAFEHRIEQLLSDTEGRIIASNCRLAESMQRERLTEVEKRLNLPPQQTQ